MRVLMIAPQPFFSPRGTPISVYGRLQALSTLGHHIDLLTYHLGDDVAIDNVRILRAGLPGLIRHVRIGPSAAKLALDVVLLREADRLLRQGGYDVIHTHEEAAVMGAVLRRRYRIPHLYDMHASLPELFVDYGYPGGQLIRRATKPIERWVLRRSDAVVVVCPYLRSMVRAANPTVPVFVIENSMPGPESSGEDDVDLPETGEDLVVLYTGNLGPNQGIDLMLDAMSRVARRARTGVRLWIVGGERHEVDRAKRLAGDGVLAERITFFGKRPAHDIPAFLCRSDILLSPRSRGTAIPLKLYSYLRSGKPIVATDGIAHRQILSDETAVLTATSPPAFGEGILSLVADANARSRLGSKARDYARSRFSPDRFVEQMCEAYAAVRRSS